MKHNKLRKLIDSIARAISNSDPDPAPMTLTPVVNVEHTKPVPLAALEQQSERAKDAMVEKRKRALSFLAANALLHLDETPLTGESGEGGHRRGARPRLRALSGQAPH
jgi:hypothetical protein